VDGYSGDAGDALQYTGDFDGNGNFGKYRHDGMMFTTNDRDNDDYAEDNCATSRGGAWWFNSCFWACLTCKPDNHVWDSLTEYKQLVNSRMMIKPQ